MNTQLIDNSIIINTQNAIQSLKHHAKKLINDGYSAQEAESICLKLNDSINEPPLELSVVKKIIKPYKQHKEREEKVKELGLNLDIQSGLLRYTNTSQKRSFLFGSDIVPMNTLSVIGGLGGSGKSQAVMQMIASSAIGSSYAGRSSEMTCSLLLGFEDSQEEINARFSAIMGSFSISQRELVEKNVRALSLVGENFQLVCMKGRNAEATGFTDLLIEKILELKEITNLEKALLVIDHARLVASIDWNDAAQVTVLTRELHRISHEADTAVVLIAHSPKNTAAATHEISQADIAGSTALVDNARYVAIIKGMNTDEAKSFGIKAEARSNYLKYECVKTNYSSKPSPSWFIKVPCQNHQVATHDYVELHKPIPEKIGDNADESKIVKYIRTNPDLTLTDLRKRAGKEGVLGMSDLKIQRTVNELLEKGLLVHVPPSTNYSKKTTPNFKGVLGVSGHV